MIIGRENHKENLRTTIACVDGNVVWANDEVLGGLYKIDRVTLEMENVMNPFQMYKYGRNSVISLVEWNDCIIIVPIELDQVWIIYNKASKEIQYLNVGKERWKTVGAFKFGEKAVLIPASTQNPILVINLTTMTYHQIISDWNKGIHSDSGEDMQSWGGAATDKEVFFPLYNTTYIVKFNFNGTEIFETDIPYGICAIDVLKDEIWILPTEGNVLYVSDLRGKIIATIKLAVNKRMIPSCTFARIVAEENYVFLLPFSGQKIYVYKKKEKKITMIEVEKKLNGRYPIYRFATAYWACYAEKDEICFMPLKNRFLRINLQTLAWEQKNLFLPDSELEDWYEWNQWISMSQEPAGKESDTSTLEGYIKFIESYYCVAEADKCDVGNEIWRKTGT